MNDNVVEAVVRANVSQYVAGMKEAVDATGSASASMHDEFGSMASAAQAAHAPMTNLTGALKEWRTHVRTEARYTNFLAAQVAGLGIASKGAAAELTGLVSAFAFGGGLGLAVEGVKLVAHAFHEIGEAEKKAKEEFDKYVEDLTAGTEKIKKQTEMQLLALSGASRAEIQAAEEIKPRLEEREALEKKIAAAELEVMKLREGEGVLVAEIGSKLADIEQKKLDKMRETLRLLTEEINKRQVLIASVATVTIAQDEMKELAGGLKLLTKKEQQRKDHLTRMHAAEAAAQVALDKMVTEHAAQRVQIDKNYEAIELELQAEADTKRKERFEELKKQTKELLGEANKFGAAWGTAIAGLITGTESLTKAFSNMAKAALTAILDMVKKAIEAYALQAAAAAAAANAGIPGIGVFLAMAAAAAMEAAVMSLLSQLPSAAIGMPYVPRDMPVFVHRGRVDPDDEPGRELARRRRFYLQHHHQRDRRAERAPIREQPRIRTRAARRLSPREDGVSSADVRYQLLELHHLALERIVRARGKGSVDELVIEAVRTWEVCGEPPRRPPPLRTGVLSPDSEWIREIVAWWLRTPVPRDVLAPAKLAQEMREAEARGDVAAVKAAAAMLQLLVGDLAHPDYEAAKRELLGLIPEPYRVAIAELADRVEFAVRPPAARA